MLFVTKMKWIMVLYRSLLIFGLLQMKRTAFVQMK